MATYYKTQGFVFKKQDRFESDRVFSIFTDEFGRLEIFGKAIRKITSKLRGGIEIFSLSEIEFVKGSNLKTLTDAVMLKKFGNIAKDINKLKVGHQISEVLDNFIQGEEKDKDIFILLRETFNKLDDHNLRVPVVQLIYYYFLWNFLSVAGYRPEIKKCIICGLKLDQYNLYFSDKNGGTICKNCSNYDINAKIINSDTIKVLRLILKKDWRILSKLKMNASSQDLFQETSDNYYRYILSGHYVMLQ